MDSDTTLKFELQNQLVGWLMSYKHFFIEQISSNVEL